MDREELELLKSAAAMADEITQLASKIDREGGALTHWGRNWLTALVAVHNSYTGKGSYRRCAATWRVGNPYSHPAGSLCADEAVEYNDELFHPTLSGDFCRHHRDQMEDDAVRFVRDLKEWRTSTWPELLAERQAEEAARQARAAKIIASAGSAQATSKGKWHAVMPDGTTACGNPGRIPGTGRWLDQPEGDRCRRCKQSWQWHPSSTRQEV